MAARPSVDSGPSMDGLDPPLAPNKPGSPIIATQLLLSLEALRKEHSIKGLPIATWLYYDNDCLRLVDIAIVIQSLSSAKVCS